MFHFVAQTGTISQSFGYGSDQLHNPSHSNFYRYLIADEHRPWVTEIAAQATVGPHGCEYPHLVLDRLTNIDLRPAFERGRNLMGY